MISTSLRHKDSCARPPAVAATGTGVKVWRCPACGAVASSERSS